MLANPGLDNLDNNFSQSYRVPWPVIGTALLPYIMLCCRICNQNNSKISQLKWNDCSLKYRYVEQTGRMF
jgi:hypothetical protein